MTVQISGSGSISGLLVGGLPAGTVDSVTLAVDAVTTTKLAAAAVTPPKLSGAQSGSAPVFAARAWAVFNGTTTGTNPPTAGGNVATVQRTGAGTYAVLFTTPMPSANYAVHVTARNNPNAVIAYALNGLPTANGFSFLTLTSAPAVADSDYVTFTVIC